MLTVIVPTSSIEVTATNARLVRRIPPERALWLRVGQGELFTALPALKQAIADDEYVIVESNSLRRFIEPAIFLQVVDQANTDFKASARQFFDLADAYLLINRANREMANAAAETQAVLLAREIKRNKPCLPIAAEDRYMSQAVLHFVRSQLTG